MPRLGDILLNVVSSEDKGSSVRTTDHPIEGGLSITDHVEKMPVKLKLTGVCSGPDAESRMAKLQAYKDSGKQITYTGRYYLQNVLIESIDETKDVDVAGTAYKFNINLKQVRVASRKVYKNQKTKPVVNKGKQQPVQKNTAKRTHVVARGETLWKIAQRYYGAKKGNLFNLIYNANKAVIGGDPDLIMPGQKLIIP